MIDKGITAPSESTVVLFGTWTNAAGSTIAADGATLDLGGDPGVVQTSTWSNAGTISGVHGSQIYFGGEYTLLGIGTLTHSADTTVWAAGTLDLSPVAPSGLTAASGANFVMLRWSDNSTKEAGYEVERSTDGVHFAPLATVGADVTTFTDLTATAGVAYSYRVRAYNAIGDSNYSNAASATLGAANHGLLATFYNSGDFSGPIVLARIEPSLNHDYTASAGPGITAPYTARW